MSSTTSQHPFIAAADRMSELQVGENGHVEHGWSKNFIEKVVQFNFQLVRMDVSKHRELEPVLIELLQKYKDATHKLYHSRNDGDCNTAAEIKKMTPYFIGLYRLIGQTRDITMGRGEYSLAFMQIAVWYDFYPEAAKYALKKFVQYSDDEEKKYDTDVHPYGSWKDIKYFCDYYQKKGKDYNHPLIIYAIDLMVDQIRHDEESYDKTFVATSTSAAPAYPQKISLAARWAPRATSKRFGWMFNIMAHKYFSHYLETAKKGEESSATYGRASRKAKMQWRKLLSRLNRFLDTTQIKQCSRNWRYIDHNKVTSITSRKQKKAFQYVDSRGVSRTQTDDPHNEDRIKCAKNFTAHVEAAMAGDKKHTVKGKRVGVGELVQDALKLLRQHPGDSSTTDQLKVIEEERNHINLQWEDNGSQNENLGPMIACVDTSGSMECDNGVPLYNAIGLGLRIAERSLLGKRVATFSATPSWVNLETATDFVGCVDKVRRSNWGLNTDFHALLDMILTACKSSRLEPRNVENMVLVILSDMQIDEATAASTPITGNIESMFQLMERQYYDAGMELFGRPYKVPHIVFWNLRKTNGFPVMTSQKNTTMMSGFSPVLINNFMEKGLDALKEYTAESMFLDMVRNSRYDCLERTIREETKQVFESLFNV